VEMMVVANDGKVLTHFNANELLQLTEEELTITPFE
jgi:hypothetical protein